MTDRVRKVNTSEEFDNVIDTMTSGHYRLVSNDGHEAVVKYNTWGSLGVHLLLLLLTGFFSFGIVNVIYAFIAHGNGDTITIKLKNRG